MGGILDWDVRSIIAPPPQRGWYESERAGGSDMLPERAKYTPQGMPKVNCYPTPELPVVTTSTKGFAQKVD